MLISLITYSLRMSSLYKYVLLYNELAKNDIKFRINMHEKEYVILMEIISYFSKKQIYKSYCSAIKNMKINILSGKIRSPELRDSIVEITKESDYVLICTESFSKIKFPVDKCFIEKSIVFKTRSCNDFYWDGTLKHYQPMFFWIPSKIYEKHQTLVFAKDYFKSEFVDYVYPIETCDINNPYININKKYLTDKYNLDISKKTLIYFLSNLSDINSEKEAIIKFSSSEMRKQYNILFIDKPYGHLLINDNFQIEYLKSAYGSNFDSIFNKKSIVDYFDYSFLMQSKIISAAVSGLSTAIRECLLFDIPVLSIDLENKMFNTFGGGNTKPIFYDQLLQKRFNNLELTTASEFCGERVKIKDNWFKSLKKIFDIKYDFKQKKDIWFDSTKPGLIKKICDLKLEAK